MLDRDSSAMASAAALGRLWDRRRFRRISCCWPGYSVSLSASSSASQSVHSPDSGDLESEVWLRVGQGAYPTQPVPGHQAPQGAVESAIGPRVPLPPTSWNALAWSRAGGQAARSFVHAVLYRDTGASLRHRCRGLDREQPQAAARAAAGSAICAIPLSIYRVVGQSASQQVCLSVYFDAPPLPSRPIHTLTPESETSPRFWRPSVGQSISRPTPNPGTRC